MINTRNTYETHCTMRMEAKEQNTTNIMSLINTPSNNTHKHTVSNSLDKEGCRNESGTTAIASQPNGLA